MSDAFNHFDQIAAALSGVLSQVVQKTALDIQAGAQQRAPVDTGFLKNSIHTEPGESDLEAQIVVGADYGIYQEFGTRFMPPHPYLIPAVEAARPGFEAALSAIESQLS